MRTVRFFSHWQRSLLLLLLLPNLLHAAENAWSNIGLSGETINALLEARNLGTQYLYAATATNGIYRTEDTGQTWTAINEGLTDLNVRSLVANPVNDRVLYAGTASDGIFRSDNRGDSWTAINNGLTERSIYRLQWGERAAPLESLPMFAGTAIGLFRSTDSGDNWQRLQILPRGNYRGITVNPQAANTLLTTVDGTGVSGVYETTDGGDSWLSSSAGFPAIGTVSYDIAFVNANTVLAATSEGLYQSSNAGDNWSRLNTFTQPSYALANPSRDTKTAYIATEQGVYVYNIMTEDLSVLDTGAEGLSFQSLLVNNNGTARTLYAGSNGNGVYQYQQTSGDNTAPTLPTVPEQTVVIGDSLVLKLTATDMEEHRLRYRLFAEPEGAKINSSTGKFLWRTSRDTHQTGRFDITVIVTEQNGTPINLSSRLTFTVNLIAPSLEDFVLPETPLSQLSAAQAAEIPPEVFQAFTPQNITQLPEAAFGGLSKDHIKNMPRDAVQAMTVEQFANLSDAASLGFTKRNIGGLPPWVVNSIKKTKLEVLGSLLKETFVELPNETIAQLLTNFNPEEIKATDIKSLLPPEWLVDEQTGRLRPPLGSRLNFRCLPLEGAIPDMVSFPSDRPDFNTGFSVGGVVSDKTVLQEFNDSLTDVGLSNFNMRQQIDGVLRVAGSGESAAVELALLADVNNMFQVSDSAPPEVSLDSSGHYVINTATGQSIRLNPAPKDITEFYQLAGNGREMRIRDDGYVLLLPPANTTTRLRNDNRIYQIVVFNPFIEQAPPDTVAGIYEDTVVYNDGTMQQITPTVLSPQTFISAALQFEGVGDVIYRTDGSFDVFYFDLILNLVPAPSITLPAVNNEFPTTIQINEDGTVLYSIRNEADIVETLMEMFMR